MRNAILKDLEYGEKKLKITENEKYTLLGRKYGEEKTEKGGKFRKCPLQDGIWQEKLKIGGK